MLTLIMILCGLPSVLLFIDFIKYLFSASRLYNIYLVRFLEFTGMLVLPFVYLWMFDEPKNDCCSDSATFSPNHKLTVYILIAVCVIVYFYSVYKKTVASPVIEVLTNSVLILGFVFNLFIAIQIKGIFWLFGNIPVGLLFIFELIKNHNAFLSFNLEAAFKPSNTFEKIAWKILTQNPVLKIPVFFILCIPLLTVIASLLLIFGQKPDSLVRAFTDTYKHGFSQLDHLCDNVQCGGHFLCSVAAKGHKKVVSPVRYGERNGNKIICNRQLLIANAFEELVEQKLPGLHKVIRRKYNKIGNAIHRHYHIFNNKFIADLIYILMKPLELFFLLTIYTCYKKPENSIATQYLNKYHRQLLNNNQAIPKH